MTFKEKTYQLNPSGLSKHEFEAMQKMFEHAPVAIGVLEGRNHRIKYMNRYLRNLFGSRTPTHGTPVRELWTKADFRYIRDIYRLEIIDKVYNTGQPHQANEFKAYLGGNTDGTLEEGYFNLIYQPLKDARDEVYGIFITGYEVTGQVKARMAKAQYEQRMDIALEGAGVGVWEMDAENERVNYISPQCKAHFGKSPDESVSRDELIKAIHPRDRIPTVNKVRERMKEPGFYEVEFQVLGTDKTPRWLLSRGQSLSSSGGAPRRVIGITMDITDQKQTEARLRQAIHVRDDFLSVAAHELQTPVTSIKARAELFERQLHDAGLSRWARQAGKIHERIEQLSRLTGSLLDISRIREGKLDLQPSVFSIEELVAETVETMDQISAHRIEIQGHSTARVRADRYRISQVLTNLLENAIKYSPYSELISVRIGEMEDRRQVVISVADFGIGISEADKQRIFERFYKGRENGRDTYPGFGIGLFISAEIVERHGGSISVEDNDEQGSVFTFTLPVDTP